MKIAGLHKLTLLDYPGKTACTVFVPGCDFHCPFCHNAELVTPMPSGDEDDGAHGSVLAGCEEGRERRGIRGISESEVLSFLEKRRGLLDGVCVSGGEPTLQPDLAAFCERVKREGFAVKLDTNGTRPQTLRALMDAGLLDAVAMDVKNAPARYAETAGMTMEAFSIVPVEESMRLLLGGAIPFEFRTTVVRELHDADALLKTARWIARLAAQEGADLASVPWFLQEFADSASVLAGEGSLSAWNSGDLRALLPRLRETLPLAALRGVG